MRITIAYVPTDSRAQNYYKTKRRRKSRVRGKTAKRRLIFSKDMRVRARADMCASGAWARVFIKLAEKRELRATGRVSMRVARESKRNDWTDNHAEARAGKWLKRE